MKFKLRLRGYHSEDNYSDTMQILKNYGFEIEHVVFRDNISPSYYKACGDTEIEVNAIEDLLPLIELAEKLFDDEGEIIISKETITIVNNYYE